MKIVVFDDDPTGSQTVHDCLLLLSWGVDVLREALRHPSPIFFVLANTRSLPPDLAAKRNREICKALKKALDCEAMKLEEIVLVSRGDSTLRGHGILEPKVISEEMGPFCATFHVPAFLEGGRTTENGIHFLNGEPVHTTAFAQDSIFGYKTSDLAAWIEEKSKGSIHKKDVISISLPVLDKAVLDVTGKSELMNSLRSFEGNQSVIVDANNIDQLMVFGELVHKLKGQKRFLFRSAASMLNGLSRQKPQILSMESIKNYRLRSSSGIFKPGMVLVGSCVQLADLQLKYLLESSECDGLELPVRKLAQIFDSSTDEYLLRELEKCWCEKLDLIIQHRKTPILYSGRGEILFSSERSKLNFGNLLAKLMSRLTLHVSPKLGYLISKGGITTHTLMEQGFNWSKVKLEGQILPGLSLVRPIKNNNCNQLPIITFPGNLGKPDSLAIAWKIMETS